MEMIIGGAYQGKTDHAKKEYPQLVWGNGALVSEKELMNLQGILDFQEYIRKELKEGRDVTELAQKLIDKGFELQSKNFFNEFVLKVNNSDQFLANLKENNILGGLKLDDNRILVCVTEMNTEEEINNYEYFAV